MSKVERGERQTHPGWAVLFEDGTWLSSAHGYFQADDAFYGLLWNSVEEAERNAQDALSDWGRTEDVTGYKYTVVLGWQPLCEKLRHDVSTLKSAAKITPIELMDITFELENVLSRLKEGLV
jgi:hypothetical protein